MKKRNISKFKYFFLKYLIAFKIYRAAKLSKKDGKRRMVININRRYKIVTRTALKKMMKLNRAGKALREIEKEAIFKTYEV